MAKKPHGKTRALKHFAPKPKEEDKLANAKQQGQAQFNSIKEMVEDLRKAEEQDSHGGADETEAPRRRIEEDALSVQVRSDWYQPGSGDADTKPAEYEILLCTGGPACRIIGELGQHGEPISAEMQVQDWFQPWTEFRPQVGPDDYDSEPIMLEYARVFYYGD